MSLHAAKRADLQGIRKSEQIVLKLIQEAFPGYRIQRQYPYKEIDGRGSRLHADFAIPQLKLLFERQGEQHYKPVTFGSGDDGESKFHKQRELDYLKKEIAEKNRWTLIEISYKEEKDMTALDLLNIILKKEQS